MALQRAATHLGISAHIARMSACARNLTAALDHE